ncbi:MAG TPA: peptidyl-tRNA hydrolase Pth2 [archaeon]|nr:peptidyl-tRNA hydrolase Pth2 [archaeon]
MYKQVIVVRNDLKLSKGKLAAQVAHASLDAYLKADKDAVSEWELTGVKKVVLRAQDLKELMAIFDKLKSAKLKPSLIKDAGHTEIEPGTVTCVGVGPVEENQVNKITGHLKML